jgi:hypothetical protein
VFDSLCAQSGCSPSVSRRSCLLREAALDLVGSRSNLRGQSVKTRARGLEGPKRQRVSLRSVVHTSNVFATLLAKCCPEEPEESPFRSTGPLGKGQALVLKTKSCSSAPWGDRQMTKENGPHCLRLDHWAILQQHHAMTISKQTFDPGTRIIPGNSWHVVCQLYTASFLTSDLHQVRTPYNPFVVVCPGCTHLGALRPPQSTDHLHPCQDHSTKT